MTDICSNVVGCLCNVITSWKLREGFSTVFVIFWDYLLGRYVLCCWSDDYGYELCPNRKPNPLRLHFHNCVFYFRFLYVILLFNFVGDPNMNSPFLYHCNSPFSFHCFALEHLSKSALEIIFLSLLKVNFPLICGCHYQSVYLCERYCFIYCNFRQKKSPLQFQNTHTRPNSQCGDQCGYFWA